MVQLLYYQIFFRYCTYCSFWCQYFVKKFFNAFVHQGMQVDVFTQNTFQPISLMMEIVKIRARNNNDLIEPVLHVSGVKLLNEGYFRSHLFSQLHTKWRSYNYIVYLLRPLLAESLVIVFFM